MSEYTLLSTKIEEQYQAYKKGDIEIKSELMENIRKYINPIIARAVSFDGYTDHELVDDLASDVLLVILEEKLDTFVETTAKFASFCGVIAKNTAINSVRKRIRHNIIQSDEIESIMDENQAGEGIYNPEKEMDITSRRMLLIEGLHKYIDILTNLKQKPYRLVGFGFSMILFHRYNPGRKILSSPKWAHEELRESNVSDGAERFIDEINEWFPYVNASWNEGFYDALDEQKNGQYIGDLVFGENFTTKDYENWCASIQSVIKSELQKNVCDLKF